MEIERVSVFDSGDTIQYEEIDSQIFNEKPCKIVIARVSEGKIAGLAASRSGNILKQAESKESNSAFEQAKRTEKLKFPQESVDVVQNFEIFKDKELHVRNLNFDNRKILKNLVIGHIIKDNLKGSLSDLSLKKSQKINSSNDEKSKDLQLKCRLYIAEENHKLNFISKFLCHCTKNIKSKEAENLSILISKLSQNELKLASSLLCPTCFKLFLPIQLDCGDSACLNCLHSNLKNFIQSPSLHNFQLLSCITCRLNISSSVIKQVLQEDFNLYEQIGLKFHCEVCNSAQSLIHNYWTESPCTHLCANCYSESVLFNHKSCRVCNAKFTHAKFSKLRTAQCEICLVKGFSVGNGFRYLGKVFCFSCFQGFALEQDLNYKRIAKGYLNKTCFCCMDSKNIAELAIKECCENWICEACYNSNGCIC